MINKSKDIDLLDVLWRFFQDSKEMEKRLLHQLTNISPRNILYLWGKVCHIT